MAAFLAAAVLAVLAQSAAPSSPRLIAATVAAVAAFIALVMLHRRTRERERWFDALTSLNADGIDRIDRNWDRLPVRQPSRSIDNHAYATDLDIYGRASLSQILGPVATPFGCAALDGWLLERAAPDAIAERQPAVLELAPMNDLRDTLALHARGARTVSPRDIERFLAWAESSAGAHHSAPAHSAPAHSANTTDTGHATAHPATSRMWLRLAAWLLPLATWSLAIAHALGFIDRAAWLIPLLATLVAYSTIGVSARRTFDRAFGREALFTYYPDMIGALARTSFTTSLLDGIAQRLKPRGESADVRLGALQRLMHLADLRLSSFHLPVFLLTMWDVHVLAALQRWQSESGMAVRDWLHALGEAEALSALATLAHDQPDWAFPDVAHDATPMFRAKALGHPLIPDDARVPNDVELGPPGTFLLITGSNMSGKSTLLRAIGVNTVLAQAGAPVCATALRMPPLDVQTSIRVQDSLARGVSYFMAELERLKQVVDAAHRVRDAQGVAPGHAQSVAQGDVPGDGRHVSLLFLLDEILHGTNTAERRIAATRVIRHLVDSGAIGAATTHDLSLAEEDALADAARLVHFTETVQDVDGRTTLHFDYRLLDGIATSTNALALMRMVGLDLDRTRGRTQSP